MQSEESDWCPKNGILGMTTENLKGFLMLTLQLISKYYDIKLFRKTEKNKTGVEFFGRDSLNSLSKSHE